MYKPADKTQTSFLDFNQPMGLKMNPDNRWIQMAGRIPLESVCRKICRSVSKRYR